MDIEKVHKAINIVNLARAWPQLKDIHDLAMRVLVKENESAAEELAKIIKEEYDAKCKADEEAAAKAKAKADAEAKANAASMNKPALQGASTNA